MKIIESLEELKRESSNGSDFAILLNGGLRSSKHIWYDKEDDQFEVFNEIDGTQQYLTSDQIMDKEHTNIGEAIRRKALVKYE